MEYLILNNGVRMPLAGYGTWQLRGGGGQTLHPRGPRGGLPPAGHRPDV